MKTKRSSSLDSVNQLPLRRGIPLIRLAFVYFALAPTAWADCREGCDLNQKNTFLGDNALIQNISGQFNTATGAGALSNNTAGFGNTAIGEDVLSSNTTGSLNTASGVSALSNNTTGTQNTATGVDALESNTTGLNNTANGFKALQSNTNGSDNTATGLSALSKNTTGIDNVATGGSALAGNTFGSENVAIGSFALFNNTIGSNNIALGALAGFNLTGGHSNIDVGSAGVAGESRTIRIGIAGTQHATFIAGISGRPVAGGVGVIIDSSGRLGTVVSSRRFKEEVRPMAESSEAVLLLQPVTFRYNTELDPEGIPQFGLVAEEVEKVNPDLVARDEQGKPYTVRYEAVNAMLLNEFLKEHQTVQELKSAAFKQEAMIARQQRQIEALTVGLQRVSVQLEAGRSSPQTAFNSQ